MSLLNLVRDELSFDQSIIKSKELASLVRKDYSPDLVIAIASGGVLPAKEISKNLGTDYSELVIRREINIKKVYESTPQILTPFVKVYQGYLFLTTNPKLIKEGDFDCSGKDILIVDDTVHTGKTLQIAEDNLKERGAKQIKSAAINYVDGIIPDYSISKGRLKFPWSKNSRDYKKFQTYAKNIFSYKLSLI